MLAEAGAEVMLDGGFVRREPLLSRKGVNYSPGKHVEWDGLLGALALLRLLAVLKSRG